MGFSSEAVLIKPAIKEDQFDAFIKHLGYSNHESQETCYFEDADSPKGDDVYICNVKGVTYIIYDEIFIDITYRKGVELSFLEKKITTFNSNCEIISLLNFEVSNSYGYSYVKDGKLLRYKFGDSEGIQEDFGEELPIEKEYYNRREIIDGKEYYFESILGYGGKYTHDQIGGSIAFNLPKMLNGFYYTDDEFFESRPIRYVKSKEKIEKEKQAIEQKKKEREQSKILKKKNIKLDPSVQFYIPEGEFSKLLVHCEQILSPQGYNRANSNIFFKRFQHMSYQIRLEILNKVEGLCKVKCVCKAVTINPIAFYSSDVLSAIDSNSEWSFGVEYEKKDSDKIFKQMEESIHKTILPYFIKIEWLSVKALKKKYCSELRSRLKASNINTDELIEASVNQFQLETTNEFWEDQVKQFVITEIRKVGQEEKINKADTNHFTRDDFQYSSTHSETEHKKRGSLDEILIFWNKYKEGIIFIFFVVSFLIILSASNSY